MKKIMIIGCPGSGKSTFAFALQTRLKLPLFHLDMLYWNSDKSHVDKQTFLNRLSAVISGDEWIIDGNYSSTLPLRFNACDTVFFLDYPTNVCLDGIKQRKGKSRVDMPWIETEDDTEFLQYVQNFNSTIKPVIEEILSNCSDKKVITFTTRTQAQRYLDELEVR